MKTHLPLLAAMSIAEAQLARTSLAESYEVQLRSRLSGEGAAITCQKGCSHCCYHPVFLTLLEGASLYKWLVDRSLWTPALKTAFQRTSETTWGLAPEVWSLSLIPCPLLSDQGLCKAYEGRPFACRVTYSIGDPNECHPHRLGPGMLPKKDLFELLTTVESPLLRKHHLTHFRIPLAAAVLYGEKIVKGELALADAQQALHKEPAYG